MLADLVISDVRLIYSEPDYDPIADSVNYVPKYKVTFIASIEGNKFPLTFDVNATGGFSEAVREAALSLTVSAQNLAALAEAAAAATTPSNRMSPPPEL
jgi:hypothetical protein